MRDGGEVDSRVGSSVGPSQVQAQAPMVEAACSRGEVRAMKVGVDSELHNLGMAGDIEAVAHKNGKGKVVVEERCSSSDIGERKIGEGSGPKGYWAEFNKRGLVSGA